MGTNSMVWVKTSFVLGGFLQVRAGARDVEKARAYVETALSCGLLPADARRRLEIVPLDIRNPVSIAPALGLAGKVCRESVSYYCTLFEVILENELKFALIARERDEDWWKQTGLLGLLGGDGGFLK